MKTIFEALNNDHDLQRSLMSELVKTSGDGPHRRSLYKILKSELTKHAKYEEQFFYKPLLGYEATQGRARHSIAEHHEIDELIDELDKTNFSSPHWLRTFKDLKGLVEHHLKEEEQEVFALAGQVLDREQKNKLGYKYDQSMQEGYS